MKTLMGARLWVNGTKVVSAVAYGFSSAGLLAAATPTVREDPVAAQPMHWPVLTGALAIALVFFTWWQQLRHRRRMEETNDELRRSEEEARRAFASLRESEEKFRLLFENTMDAIMFLDPQTQKYVDCNEAAVKASRGGTREWFLSQAVSKLSAEFQPDGTRSEEKLVRVITNVLEKGPQRLEWTARRFTGEDFMVDALVMPIRIANRTLLVVVCRDITEKKRAEIVLRQNEQLLASILDNISEGIYRSSPDRGLIFVNRAYLKMFGYASLDELRDLPRERLYANPEDRPRLLRAIDDHGGYTNEEVEYRRKDGTTFWGLASSIAVYEPETQRVAYHVGTITNITERKEAEDEVRELNQDLERRIAEQTAELRASEAQFRTLVEHAPEAIVVFDGETGRFLSGNENALRLYGVSREELLQLMPGEVSPPFQPNGLTSAAMGQEMIRRARAGEAPVFEWMHRSRKGRLIPTEVRLVRLPAEGKCLLRASILDTSERRRREQIQQATYQISEAVHATEDLESLYERIHQVIKSLMPADNFYIAVLDPVTELISFPYFVDQLASGPPEPRRITTGLTGYVLRTGKPLLIDRSTTERKKQVDEGVLVEGMELPYVESGRPAAIWLGTPLTFRGKTFGVMAVQDYQNERAYGEDEKAVLVFIAEQTALAIERKCAEEALKQRHREVVTLLESLPGYAFFKDAEGRYVMANQNFCRAVGQIGNAIVGKTDHDLFPTELAAKYRRDDAGLLLSGEMLQVGEEQMMEGERSFYVQTTKVPVKNERNEVVGLIGLGFDITERKRAEEELRASEARLRESDARFRSAFYNSPVRTSIARVSDGRFIEVNDAFLDHLGLPRSEVIGRTSVELDIWVDPAERTAFWGDLERQRAIRHREVTLRNRRGAFFTMLLSADIVEIRGEPHVLVNALDITERKQAEQELLRALAREKELSQLKSNFVSLVSHEFRTPLGVIMSSSQILDDYFEQLERAERREHLRSIQKHTRRMADMMEEVLLLSRAEAGKLNFDPRPLDMRVFARRLVEEVLSASNRRCSIDLSLELTTDEATGDERLLRHILTNLLSNAVKYSPEGARVRFDIRQDDACILFAIRDEGIGIPQTDQDWLFNAFHRGTNVGNAPGTGLGLVIVKRCVELHGGTIHIESAVGQGTRVEVSVPMFELALEKN